MESTTLLPQTLDCCHRIVFPIYNRLVKRRVAYIKLACGGSKNHRFIIDGYANVGAGILRLLHRGRPTAVTGFVVSIHIDAVNRMFSGWAWSHIVQKGRKTSAPLVAHGDASSAVVLITEIETAFPDSRPDIIFTRDRRTINSRSMRATSCRSHFGRQASAAFRMPCHKMNGTHRRKSAAITTALPRSEPFGEIPSAPKSHETSKSFASSIYQWH